MQEEKVIIVEKEKWSWKDFFIFLFLTIIIVIPIRTFVAQPFVVSGDSMLPNFHTGEYLMVDQLTYHLGEPERGDVVVFKFPQDTSKFFIKRIIGLPNETILIDGFDVYIKKANSQDMFLLEEKFIELDRESNLEVTLGPDEYFVMGDNRLQSLDSRIWGPLKKEYILGRAFVRLFPLETVGFLPEKVDYGI